MEHNNNRRVTGSDAEPKLLEHKKRKRRRSLWWLLLAILIILLAIWFSTHHPERHERIYPSPSKDTATQTTPNNDGNSTADTNTATDTNASANDNAASNDNSAVTPPAVQDDNVATEGSDTQSSTLAKLQSYFSNEDSADSEWLPLEDINFASGSAEPEVTNPDQLNKIAELLAQHSENKLVIRGFTDSTGDQALNQTLSQHRANAVKAWFIDHNIAEDRISVEGRADEHAVANNATPDGREQNRRVDLQVKSSKVAP